MSSAELKDPQENPESVKLLFQVGVVLSESSVALHAAAQYDNPTSTAILNLLLQKCGPNLLNYKYDSLEGRTALHTAVAHKNYAGAELLMWTSKMTDNFMIVLHLNVLLIGLICELQS